MSSPLSSHRQLRTVRRTCAGVALLLLGCSSSTPKTSSNDEPVAPKGTDSLSVFPTFASAVSGSRPLARTAQGFSLASSGKLELRIPDTTSAPLRLAVRGKSDQWVEVRPEGLSSARASVDSGVVTFANAIAPDQGDGDVVMIVAGDRVEEVRVLRKPSGWFAARYALRLGEGLVDARVRDGRVELLTSTGYSAIATDPMFVVDAHGTRRDVDVRLHGAPPDVTMEIEVSTNGLVAPIAVDPVWTTTPSMKFARGFHAVVDLADGTVLAAGGRLPGAPTNSTATAEVYDPTTNTWTAVASMGKAREDFAFARLSTGKVLVHGGVAYSAGAQTYPQTSELYDPTTKTWSLVTSVPSPPSFTTTRGPMVKLPGSKVMIFNSPLTAIYDAATNSWSSGGSMVETRYSFSASPLADGRVLVSGGVVSIFFKSTAEIYDPTTSTWTATGNMVSRREYHSLTLLPSGKVLAAGGRNAGGTAGNTAELYDPATGIWSAVGNLPYYPDMHASVLLNSSHVLIAGGTVANATLFDGMSTFLNVDSLAGGVRFGAIGVPLSGGRAIVAGGFGSGGFSDAIAVADVYTPNANGVACTTALSGNCASGICADSVCCDKTCLGACEQCNLGGSSGTCTALTGAPHAGRTCAPFGSCSAGACATSCTTDTDCVGSAYCAGTACVPKKSNGATCTATNECTSGNCVDSVCCNAACTGQCEACDIGGSVGTCSAVTGTPRGSRTACPDAGKECGPVCNGTVRSTCTYLPSGVTPCSKNSCDAGTETHASTCDGTGKCSDAPKTCGSYVCGVASCKTACGTKLDCAPGFVCVSSACVPAPGLGEACTDSEKCSTGYCTDGVCCGVGSCGAGASCALPGKLGKCAKLDGVACAAGDECGSGKCIDKVCCNGDCTGQCEACDVPGQAGKCSAVKGKPHAGRPACAVDDKNPCATALCDASDTTKCAGFVGTDVACREASCKDGKATVAGNCDGKGACPTATTTDCGAYACDTARKACFVTCTATGSECAKDHKCQAGKCRPIVATCSADFSSSTAVDGTTKSCAPYKCKAGECLSSCGNSSDCAAGFACESGTCVSTEAATESSGGCSISSSSSGNGNERRPFAVTLAAIAAMAIFVRRRIRARAILAVSATTIAVGCQASDRSPVPESGAGVATVEKTTKTSAQVVEALRAYPHIGTRVSSASSLIRTDKGFERVQTQSAGFKSAGPPLAATIPARAGEPLVLSVGNDPDVRVSIEALDLSPNVAEMVSNVTIHREVARGTDLVHLSDAHGVEELRYVREASSKIVLRHRITIGAGVSDVRARGDRIEIVDTKGYVRIASTKPFAVDAHGERRTLSVSLTREGSSWIAKQTLESSGLAVPIAIDPSWTTVAAAKYGHTRGTAVTVPSGDYIVFGGEIGQFTEIYKPSTNSWSDGAFPTIRRTYSTATVLPSGKVLVPGGVNFSPSTSNANADVYDPTANTWGTGGTMAFARELYSSVLLPSPYSKVLVAGGRVTTSTSTTITSVAELYDPTTNTWSTIPSMATARAQGAVAVLPSKKVLVIGGAIDGGAGVGITNVELFDPAANSWSSVASLSTARNEPTAIVLPSGKVFVAGGPYPGLSTTEIYDPSTNTWSAGPNMKTLRRHPVLEMLPTGKVLVTAGSSSPLAEVYDPATSTLSGAGTMSYDRGNGQWASISGGRVILSGGQTFSTFDTLVEAEVFQQQANGAPCTGSGECTSGFCADGYCCNSACNTSCQACNLSGSLGTCGPVTGTPLVGHPSCSPYTSCVSGACASSCTKDADCTSGNYCNGTACVAKKATAATCTDKRECLSGSCADGVCCSAACDGQCEACDVAGSVGTCVAVSGTPHGSRPACTGTGVGTECGIHCDGVSAKTCVYPPAGISKCSKSECTAGVETHASSCDGVGRCSDVPKDCGAFACSGVTCKSTCSVTSDCAAGFVCKGTTCVPAPGLGQPCSTSTPCEGTLFCTDGVCCGTATCPTGSSCALPAKKGTCAKNNAEKCTVDAECGSGACTDSVCCESSCAGQCQACDVTGSIGKCVPIKGAPHGTRLACGTGSGAACEATVCDGSDASRCAALVGSDVKCREPKCVDGIATVEASCTGSGSCPDVVTKACAPFTCDDGGKACRTSCTKSTECSVGFTCKAGTCVKAEASCSADGKQVLDPDGVASDCTPFKCKGQACLEKCATSDDCIDGTLCDESGRCLPASAPAAATEESGGCTTSTRGSGSIGLLLGLCFALGAIRRRR